MTLSDVKNQYIYDQCEELQKLVVTRDLLQQNLQVYHETYCKIDQQLEDKIFTLLMVAMGENIPTHYWTVSGYSVLYELLMDNKDLNTVSE